MTAAAAITATRARLREIADHIRADIAGRVPVSASACEWARLNLSHRMAVLLLCGMDGELSVLARRSWQEFTPVEKSAITVELRSLHRSLDDTYALRMRLC